ncbi:MAG TPA: hypothetical protein VMY99_02285 [Nevskiaceae bacterium]|nr:hypothetical protein [Nevskiaceae bacterium]
MGTDTDKQDKEEQNKEAGQSAEAAEDQQAPQHESGRHNKKRRWLLLLLLILLLIAVLCGWLWWHNRDKDDDKKGSTSSSQAAKKDSGTADEEEAVCAEGLTAYENTSLSFGFCYPTAWGAVSTADAKFAAADAGSRWRLSFAGKPQVHIGVASADWATAVAREGTCVDPARPTLPAFAPFSTTWVTETGGGPTVSSGTRGVEVLADHYLIQEYVDDLLTSGVCLEGFTVINAPSYAHTDASYSVDFGGTVTTPQQHINNPNTLIPAADRDDFAAFVKSVHKL